MHPSKMLKLRIFCVILILIAAVTSDDSPPDQSEGEETPAADEGEGGQPNEGDGDDATGNSTERDVILLTGPGGTKEVERYVRMPCSHLLVYTDHLVKIMCYRTQESHGKEEEYACGGTLIDPVSILTASHCVKNVAKVVIHITPDSIFHFESEMDKVLTFVDDLAMVKLKKRVPRILGIKFAKLPGAALAENIYDDCKNILFAGWGKTWAEDGSGWCDQTLMCAYLPIGSQVNGEPCSEFLEPPELVVNPSGSNDNWFCSMPNKKSNGSACYGDAGGAAFCAKTKELLGVLSYVSEDCKGGAVFTRVDGQLYQIRKGLKTTITQKRSSNGSRLDFDISLFLFAIAMEIIVTFM